MTDFLINVALLIAILGTAYFLTNWYARAYITCSSCRTMNARRRAHCRKCGQRLDERPR